MFVKVDNRYFQQELANEATMRETKSQSRDVQMQDQPPVGVTAEALSRLVSEVGTFEVGTGGKRKYSVGSSVATNGSIRSDLADVEFALNDPQPVFGDTIESTEVLPGQRERDEAKIPEMSERRGGISFLARADPPAHNSMDLDTEHDLRDG